MKEIETFLETSTIHGLGYLPQTNGFIRLFWIFIVVTGFSGAFYLILMSFDNWETSPVSTTIETKHISKLTFPNVTICPPKNSYTNINMDIIESEKISITRQTIDELRDYAHEVLQEAFYNELLKNLSKVEDPNRFSNWYNGFTDIEYPYYDKSSEIGHLNYSITTSASTGNISFNLPDKNMKVKITVKVPVKTQEVVAGVAGTNSVNSQEVGLGGVGGGAGAVSENTQAITGEAAAGAGGTNPLNSQEVGAGGAGTNPVSS